MSLTRDEVRHVASLARLELSEAETEHLVTDLGNILKHFAQLQALDTGAVLAASSGHLPLQADVPVQSLTHEQALAPAPRALNEGFAVPAILDEG